MSEPLERPGKLFGLINPVDLVVILLLVALGIKIFSDYRPAPLDFNEHPITVRLLIHNVPPSVVDSLSVGQDLFEDGRDAYLGKIYLKNSQPAELLIQDQGRLIMAQSPRNFDLTLEVKRKGRIVTGPAHIGVYLGKLAIRVGDQVKAHTLYTSITGEVESLRVK